MRFRYFLAGLFWAALIFPALAAEHKVQSSGQDYDYPFINAFEATVIGTPSFLAAELPERVPKQVVGLKIFPEREIPEIFWYQDQLRFSIVRRRSSSTSPAPGRTTTRV